MDKRGGESKFSAELLIDVFSSIKTSVDDQLVFDSGQLWHRWMEYRNNLLSSSACLNLFLGNSFKKRGEKMSFENFTGMWRFRDASNFEAYLTQLGVGYSVRSKIHLLDNCNPVITIKGFENIGEIETVSIRKWGQADTAVSAAICKFQLGKDVVRELVDGRGAKSRFTLADGILSERQFPIVPTERESTIQYRIEGDGRLLVISYQSGEILARRTYEKL